MQEFVVPCGHEEITIKSREDGGLNIIQKRFDESEAHAIVVGPSQIGLLIQKLNAAGIAVSREKGR